MIGYLKSWRTFILIERGFEISAVAQLGSSQSKTKPRLPDYATQLLYTAKVQKASLFKPDTVRLRPQLPPPLCTRVFERRKFFPCKHAHIVPQVVLSLFAQRRPNSSSASGSKVSRSDSPARWLHWLPMWCVFCKQCAPQRAPMDKRRTITGQILAQH